MGYHARRRGASLGLIIIYAESILRSAAFETPMIMSRESSSSWIYCRWIGVFVWSFLVFFGRPGNLVLDGGVVVKSRWIVTSFLRRIGMPRQQYTESNVPATSDNLNIGLNTGTAVFHRSINRFDHRCTQNTFARDI